VAKPALCKGFWVDLLSCFTLLKCFEMSFPESITPDYGGRVQASFSQSLTLGVSAQLWNVGRAKIHLSSLRISTFMRAWESGSQLKAFSQRSSFS
jgi:hypothetical protein